MTDFELGIDRFVREPELREVLRGRRVALLGHPASVTSSLEHSLEAMARLSRLEPRFELTAAFGPQHGLRGEKQDNMQETEDSFDPRLGIPIFSLYGEVRRPTTKMLSHFDVLVVDLQDVGTRIYTFLTTLLYALEAAAEHGKTIVVLDRPNPAGRPIEGSALEPGWLSFVGAAERWPMRHGLTLGEAARVFVEQFQLRVDLHVVAMQGYDPHRGPGFGWPTDALSWVNPSPNAATLSMARCFPGTVLLEGTHLSEGRGTTRPLELLGGPELPIEKVLAEMQRLAPEWTSGCRLRPCHILPTFQKHAGHIIPAFQIHVDGPVYDHAAFRPYRLIGLALKAVVRLAPSYELFRDFHYEYEKDRLAFDLINGGPCLRNWIEDPAAWPQDLESRLVRDEQEWYKMTREEYLY